MTELEFVTWLREPSSQPCVLVEAYAYSGGLEVVRYMSSSGYTTSPTDSPANTNYTPCIVGGVSISESLSAAGEASLSWGDIEISNIDGARDAWLYDVWVNRDVTVYVGDVRWNRATFRLVFTGKIEDLIAKNADTLNLLIRDKGQILNTPLSEVKLEGTTQNKDRLLPLCFGEVHNIEPLLVDPMNLEYQIHDGPIERIIEVRDSGVPVPITEYLLTGKFRLLSSPVGGVTVSAQGSKLYGTYSNNAATIVKYIVKNYGKTHLTDSDLDLAQITAFEAANTAPVGVYIPDTENCLQVCEDIVNSFGASIVFTATGLMQIARLDLASLVSTSTVDETDIVLGSLSLKTKPSTVKAAVRLNYCRNYTVQADTAITGGIPTENRDSFAKEWLVVEVNDSAVAATYRLTETPEEEPTLLLTKTAATAEANRRLNLWKTRRNVFSYEGTPDLMLIPLGSGQTLKHSRFGLSAGQLGQVVGKSISWLERSVSIEVLI